jgi:hypothetical protein
LVSGGTIATIPPELAREPLTPGLASCDSRRDSEWGWRDFA